MLSALWISIIGDIIMSVGAGQTLIAAFPDIYTVAL